jgi:hypothetical protein
MDASIVISASALAFSIISFTISMIERHSRNRIQLALFDIERDTSYEAKLAEWPSALKFHGIDLKAAQKDRIAPEDITYLVLSVGAWIAYCTAIGGRIYSQLKESDYRQRMFAQVCTRHQSTAIDRSQHG